MFVNKSTCHSSLLAEYSAAAQTMLYSAGTNTSVSCPEAVRTAVEAANIDTLEWFCRGCEDEGRGSIHAVLFTLGPLLNPAKSWQFARNIAVVELKRIRQ